MNTYETIYLINETANLIGQAMFDIITVIFTIIAAALFGAHRLTRTVVVGIAILSAIWVLPMLGFAYEQIKLAQQLQHSLTPQSLAELSGIARFIGADSLLAKSFMPIFLVGSHALTYLAAVWFLNDSRKRHGVVDVQSGTA